jgi:hypothetical protein
VRRAGIQAEKEWITTLIPLETDERSAGLDASIQLDVQLLGLFSAFHDEAEAR